MNVIQVIYKLQDWEERDDLGRIVSEINHAGDTSDIYDEMRSFYAPSECYALADASHRKAFRERLMTIGISSWEMFEIVIEAITRRTSQKWVFYHLFCRNPFDPKDSSLYDDFPALLRLLRKD